MSLQPSFSNHVSRRLAVITFKTLFSVSTMVDFFEQGPQWSFINFIFETGVLWSLIWHIFESGHNGHLFYLILKDQPVCKGPPYLFIVFIHTSRTLSYNQTSSTVQELSWKQSSLYFYILFTLAASQHCVLLWIKPRTISLTDSSAIYKTIGHLDTAFFFQSFYCLFTETF